MAKAAAATLPEGFETKDGIAWGSRRPGLLEIAYWNHKRKNSVTGAGQKRMSRLIGAAQTDDEIKAIFIHGGLFYCSGNDLSVLSNMGSMDEDDKYHGASYGVEFQMVANLLALLRSKKPVVGLVRG